MKRKHDSIDLMKLYSLGSSNGWNQMLSVCLRNLDINKLMQVKYGIESGMDDLVKKKLNTDDVNVWYLRLVKSIENTAKQIIKIRNPLPHDNPLIAKDHSKTKDIKTKRDKELYDFIKKSSF